MNERKKLKLIDAGIAACALLTAASVLGHFWWRRTMLESARSGNVLAATANDFFPLIWTAGALGVAGLAALAALRARAKRSP